MIPRATAAKWQPRRLKNADSAQILMTTNGCLMMGAASVEEMIERMGSGGSFPLDYASLVRHPNRTNLAVKAASLVYIPLPSIHSLHHCFLPLHMKYSAGLTCNPLRQNQRESPRISLDVSVDRTSSYFGHSAKIHHRI
jgi:hypothetical protein